MLEQNKQQPAAAQEAVAYWRVTFRMYPENIDCCETFVRGPDRPTLGTLGISPRPVQIIRAEPFYAAPATAAPAEPDLDAHDPASGELAAQWLYRNGFKELAYVIRTQLDMRGARIRELSASTPAAPGIDLAALRARVVSAIERITSGAASMRIPADMTDPDLVLGDVLGLLDSLGPQTDASPEGDCQHCAGFGEMTGEAPGVACPVCNGTGKADSPKGGSEAAKDGEVLVTVCGLTGSGKSAVAGEIEILCKALGLEVEWADSEEEKRLTHADWTEALELYKPRVRIVEVNIPRAQAGDAEVQP